MLLAVQYYRPPFPGTDRFDDDLQKIADLGIDAVQLWMTWGWIESEPGVYKFDDYDRIVQRASDVGLRVVLSTIAEVQPFWIHRLEPGSELVTHRGHAVRSVPRRENNVGLTPGGCTDNPGVRDRMGAFLAACATRYRDTPNLVAWDVWNETRWSVHAGDYVCYCPHTLASFRAWLEQRHGDLDGLNAAWRRRYTSWGDVQPGSSPALMYSDTMEFQRFLTWRAGEHMAFRAETVRELDARHTVSAHCVAPAVFSAGQRHEQALSRGNDWDHVRTLDAYGLSMYPDYFITDPADIGVRLASIRSACGDRDLWVSELEAGPTGLGFTAGRTVTGADLELWIWAMVASCARAAILWQWYDEFIGEESAAFGLDGHDAGAASRLAGIRRITEQLRQHREVLDSYQLDKAQVAVLFDESNHYLDWAQSGPGGDLSAHSVISYARAVERIGVPYEVLHGRHLTPAALDELRLVIVPAGLVVAPAAKEALIPWVRAGGTILLEAGADGWDEFGIYRYPADRDFCTALGVGVTGRNPIKPGETVTATVGAASFAIPASGWQESCRDSDGNWASTTSVTCGAGAVYYLGTLAGRSQWDAPTADFESMIGALVEIAGVSRPSHAHGRDVFVKCGPTKGGRAIFVLNQSDLAAEVRIGPGEHHSQQYTELDGASVAMTGDGELVLTVAPRSVRVLLSGVQPQLA